MDERERERLLQMEQRYWWHVGRRHLIVRLLQHHLPRDADLEVLDVGTGTGRNLELLSRFGNVTGIEPAGPALEYCRRHTALADHVVEGRAEELPFPEQAFGLVTCFDVLEHLPDDESALREFCRVLRPGGLVLLTVPAYRFLWSVHDEALGHQRRYMASEVHSKLNRTGFKVIRRTYAVSLALPGIMAFRVAQGLVPDLYHRGASYVDLPAPVNRILAGSLKLESHLSVLVDLPAGATVVALGQRR